MGTQFQFPVFFYPIAYGFCVFRQHAIKRLLLLSRDVFRLFMSLGERRIDRCAVSHLGDALCPITDVQISLRFVRSERHAGLGHSRQIVVVQVNRVGEVLCTFGVERERLSL